jgi:Kef-type K+ transport system membrane component KefB
MDLTVTAAAAILFLILAVLFGWLGARPINVLKGPRLIPWRPMMMICVVGLMLMLVHLVNLLGVQTGGQTRY